MLTYYLFRVAAWLVPLLPLRPGYVLASLAADVCWVCKPRARKSVEANLRYVIGPGADSRQVKALARRVFHTAAKNYYDLFRVRKLDLSQVRGLVALNGLENLNGALKRRKGVILVLAHLGNLDLVAQVSAAYSYRVTIPVEHFSPQKLFELVTKMRVANGLNFVPVDGGALRAIHRALSNNEVVAIASDRDVLRNGVEVHFFGKATTVPDAPAVLALRTGAVILPTVSLRHDDGTYSISMGPPLDMRYTGDLRKDVRYNSQAIVYELEKFIRQHPEQWVVFEPIWAS